MNEEVWLEKQIEELKKELKKYRQAKIMAENGGGDFENGRYFA